MTVSIIICTCNRAEHLRLTLDSLQNICVPPQMAVELLIVDNASTDHTAEVVQSVQLPGLDVVYLYESRLGQTNARNAAMRVARGDIFLWTDDDVRVPRNWIEEMCAPILQGAATGVAGKVKMSPHLERPWMTRTHYDRLSDTRFMPDDFGSMIGANMAFHRRVLQDVPEYDEELGPGALGFADDTLFSFQMHQTGHKIAALPAVVVEHHFDSSRLLRRAWLSHGEATGKSLAFVHYHWYCRDVHAPHLRLFLWRFALALFRRIKPPADLDQEGCDRREIRIVQHISFVKQFLVERQRPRKYDRYIKHCKSGPVSSVS